MPRLSAKTELAEVAISKFAESGFKSTSLRSIAAAADVSPALLVHHFGSKEGLIEHCIEQALGEWISTKTAMSTMPLSSAVGTWQESVKEHGSKLRFFKQLMIEGGEYANLLFQRMVAEAERFIDQSIQAGIFRTVENKKDLALIMTLHGLGPLVLENVVNNFLGGKFTDPKLGLRLAAANNEIYEKGIYLKQKEKVK